MIKQQLILFLEKELSLTIQYDLSHVNSSYIAGRDVYIGKYDNLESELISIFHEYGHTKITQDLIKFLNYNTLLIELECWNIGLKKAESLGFHFSDQAIKWGYEQALSYVGWDERECNSYGHKVKPNLLINKLTLESTINFMV